MTTTRPNFLPLCACHSHHFEKLRHALRAGAWRRTSHWLASRLCSIMRHFDWLWKLEPLGFVWPSDLPNTQSSTWRQTSNMSLSRGFDPVCQKLKSSNSDNIFHKPNKDRNQHPTSIQSKALLTQRYEHESIFSCPELGSAIPGIVVVIASSVPATD